MLNLGGQSMKHAFIAIAACTALWACGPDKQETPAPAQQASEENQNPNGAISGVPTGWLAADGPGETAAVWRETPDSVEFSLTCSMANKELAVLAKKPMDNVQNGAAASLFIGAEEFKTTATAIDDSRQVVLKLPVTAKLLKALSVAKTTRVVIGDAFTETGVDDKNTLADLAMSCAAITNTPMQ